MLPTDAAERKEVPIATCVLDYFPDAISAVAAVSRAGQKQHGTSGWDRSKSGDEADALMRHFMERGRVDTDGLRHSAKMAWRALALLQKELEAAPKPQTTVVIDPKQRSLWSWDERKGHWVRDDGFLIG